MSVKHLSPLPSLGNIWKWTETFLSRRCMTLYNSAKNCSVIHKIELDLDISMIILYISSVNATSVKKMWRKWTKTVNIWNFISPWDITVENCLVVPKIKLDIMVNLFQNLLSVSETSAKKMETTNNWNGSTCKRHNSVDNWSIVPKNRTLPWYYYDKSVN